MTTVADLKVGERGVIREFSETDLPVKLLELGCLPGNEVALLYIAPLKDPLYVEMNGSHLAIRKEVARHIAVDLLTPSATP